MRGVFRGFVLSLAAWAFTYGPAHALSVGEFRKAYNVLHALDPLSADERVKYIAEHKHEIDVANAQLSAAETIRVTLYRANGVLIHRGAKPIFCDYDEDDDDDHDSIADWVDEFRSDTMERNKLLAGPESDKMLDSVQLDDVIVHKLFEEHACPWTGTSTTVSADRDADHHH